jgi:hypothetical protein
MVHSKMFLTNHVLQLHVTSSLFGPNILPVSLGLLRGLFLRAGKRWSMMIKYLFFHTITTNMAILLACGIPAKNDTEEAKIELR